MQYKYCMSCGEKLPAEAGFCKKCGAKADDLPEETEKRESVKKMSDNKPLRKSTIAIVLILTAAAAAGAAFLTVAAIKSALEKNGTLPQAQTAYISEEYRI